MSSTRAERENRVKSIRNRFETLSEQAGKRPGSPAPGGSFAARRAQALRARADAPDGGDGDRFGASRNFGNRKRLKESPEAEAPPPPSPPGEEDGGADPRPLSRQLSDPAKRLQRTPAFRCDKREKLGEAPPASPERPAPGRVSIDREKMRNLARTIEERLREDGLSLSGAPPQSAEAAPKSVLDMYARVSKPKRGTAGKPDAPLSDSGLGSDGEPPEAADPPGDRVASADTLRKVMSQPLPPGPPPKKPPRTFASAASPDAGGRSKGESMLAKIEKSLHRGKVLSPRSGASEAAETLPSAARLEPKKKKETHYMCTEILGLPFPDAPNCSDGSATSEEAQPARPLARYFNSLNCSGADGSARAPEVGDESGFRCYLNCARGGSRSTLVAPCPAYGALKKSKSQEHIYDEPFRPASTRPAGAFARSRTRLEDGFAGRGSAGAGRGADVPFARNAFKSRTMGRIGGRTGSADEGGRRVPRPALSLDGSPSGRLRSAGDESEAVRRKSAPDEGESPGAASRRSHRFRDDASPSGSDRQNISKLMADIYDTVAAICAIDDSSPHDTTNSTSVSQNSLDKQNDTEDESFYEEIFSTKKESIASFRLARRASEKRKEYVISVKSSMGLMPRQSSLKFGENKADFYSNRSASLKCPNSKNSFQKLRAIFEYGDFDREPSVIKRDKIMTEKKISQEIKEQHKIFDACVLIGMDLNNHRPYVESVFPENAKLPPNIETLVFPEEMNEFSRKTKSSNDKIFKNTVNPDSLLQSLILTNEEGKRTYGYCRRVLPDGTTFSLPLIYCMISVYRAPSFYYKILKEIESRHGSYSIIKSILNQLHEKSFPKMGETIIISSSNSLKRKFKLKNSSLFLQNTNIHLGNAIKSTRNAENEYIENVNGGHSKQLTNNNICMNNDKKDTCEKDFELLEDIILKRSELRFEEDYLSILFSTISVDLLIEIFGSLLLERKVLIISDDASKLSLCIEGLQTILYPFIWQHTLISIVPPEYSKDVFEIPVPILAGVYINEEELNKIKRQPNFHEELGLQNFEEGMVIRLNSKKKTTSHHILRNQGDESTILPPSLAKALRAALQLVNKSVQLPAVNAGLDDHSRKKCNNLVAEAFLRFFTTIFTGFKSFLKHKSPILTAMNDGDDDELCTFDKEGFINSVSSNHIQLFLEWFIETVMCQNFIEHQKKIYLSTKCKSMNNEDKKSILDELPYPDFYDIFDNRLSESAERIDVNASSSSKNRDKTNKNMHNKINAWRKKLRDLIN